MATQIQFRRGSSSQNDAFTGALAEITVDTTNKVLRVHDGATVGGFAIAGTNATQTLTNKTLTSPVVNSAMILNAQAELQFADSDSSHYVAFKSPSTIGANVSWTLPSEDATVSGYALVSNGAGTLSWAPAGATISQDESTNSGLQLYFASTTSGALTAVKYDSGLTYNPSTGTLAATIFSGTATQAQYADLAEKYVADKNYEPGTVLIFGGEKEVQASSKSYETAIAGVVSTNPAYLMNSGLTEENTVSIALVGRVPCKVLGPVSKGTVLVTSEQPGVAMAIDNSKFLPGCIIGRAMEDFSTVDAIQLIEVAVGRS